MPYNADDSDFDQPRLDELITLREAAELSGLSASHLRLLVSRKDIWGIKLGQNWFTTAQTVKKYLARDRRPGPGQALPHLTNPPIEMIICHSHSINKPLTYNLYERSRRIGPSGLGRLDHSPGGI